MTPGRLPPIIDLKTAELFRVSCFMGARLSGPGRPNAEAAGRFGRHLGIAYQIYDDLADFFGEEKRIGKTLGTDFASGKLTLPLFQLRESLPAAERGVLAEEIAGRRPPQPALRLERWRSWASFPRWPPRSAWSSPRPPRPSATGRGRPRPPS